MHRKSLGAAFADRLRDYMSKWLPILNRHRHHTDADPDRKALFIQFDSTEFRKLMVDVVCKARALH